jgi:curved DNA-binding protein CbpA
MSSKNRQDDDQLDDLFNTMKPKKTPVDKLDSSDEEDIKQVKKFGMDYYKILGVPKDATSLEVKKRYRHLIAKHHPDKQGNVSEKVRKQRQENYMLIRIAGEVLTNSEKRKHYDLEQKVLRSRDYDSQKSNFKEFTKLQESEITEEKRKMAQLEFKRDVDLLNKMRGFNPDDVANALSKTDTEQRLEDLKAQREIEFIESSKPNIFEGRSFSNDEFNKMFDKYKRRKDKKDKKLRENGELVKYDDDRFTAFNDAPGGSYVSVNADYGEIFGGDNFSGNSAFGKIERIPEDEGSDISSCSEVEDATYYDNHNKNRGGVMKDYEALMKKREDENKMYESMKYGDYKDVMHDEFGISKDFGVVIGRDITKQTSSKHKQIDSSTAKMYNRMLKHDKKPGDGKL